MTVLLVLGLAAAAYAAVVFGPPAVLHYEVKQVVRDYGNQAVKNPDDAQLLGSMVQKIRTLDDVAGVDEAGRKITRPGGRPQQGGRPLGANPATPPTLHVAFEYPRTLELPLLDRVVERVYRVDLTMDQKRAGLGSGSGDRERGSERHERRGRAAGRRSGSPTRCWSGRGRRGRWTKLAIVGIRRGGVPLAERLRAEIAPGDRVGTPPLGTLDIALYRDDLAAARRGPGGRPHRRALPAGGQDHRARRRRALHRPHHPGRARRAGRLRPAAPGLAGGAGGPRRAGAAHRRRLRRRPARRARGGRRAGAAGARTAPPRTRWSSARGGSRDRTPPPLIGLEDFSREEILAGARPGRLHEGGAAPAR